MSFDYIRKLVSGNKARFIDPEAAVNLDLVYGEFLFKLSHPRAQLNWDFK